MSKKTSLDVTLVIPGLPFNGNTFDSLSIGGSESGGYYMGRALAKLGHRVTVFCNTEQAVSCKDVDYRPLADFKQWAAYTPHDVCIIQRMPELFSSRIQARFSALWCHDLALLRQESAVRGTAWNYDKLFVLSEFMRSQYQQVYGLPDELIYVTRNGVDLELIDKVRKQVEAQKVVRNPISLVYSARPERGLDVLLRDIMPRILAQEPNARLFVSSYHNPVETLAEFYGECDQLASALGNSVVKLGSLTKAQLYEVFHTAAVYVYPVPSPFASDFDEVSCISLMEAQACGLPVVTTARGALPESLAPGAGVLVQEPVNTLAYFDAFADATVNFMRSPEAHRAASMAGLERAQQLSWDGVAEAWSELFERELRAKSADLATLANHFWRHSDIYAAKECLKRLPADDVKSFGVRERIEQDWAFLDAPEGFRRQYEGIGSTHDPVVLQYAPQEPRYAALRDWLKLRSKEMRTVLDYGCAHGAYATNLLKEFPELSITGMDIDRSGIEMAYRFAEQLGVSARWRGVVGDYPRLTDPDVPEMTEEYDAVLAQEVLEHVPDPTALLMQLEQRVRDGGYVYITVPYGPWEYADYRRYPFRAHVWEFDLHDIYDLLGDKGAEANVSICAMPFGNSTEIENPLGWWVIQYKVTSATRSKVGRIDMERKLWLQRPRQTISAAIIAGPNSEETLHWCLRSLEHIADEIVIADCGLSEEAKRVIETYRWNALDTSRIQPTPGHYALSIKVVPGCDPKVQGFETPRNMGLEHCTQDWILWIDTDEKLLQPASINKYLRANIFQGYSIKQHHFAVDTSFDPDLPVRLFRNNGRLHWFGCIHEHPEEDLNAGPGRTIVISDVHIPHMGYLIESGRKQRFARNLPMLQKDMEKYPDRILQKHFIMRDQMLLNTYELQQNGGKITPQIQARAQEIVRLYREHFLGKGHMSNVDPIEYYSQANTILGQGFDAVIQLSADKFDAKMNGALKARFASMDDYMTEVTRRARETVQRFETRYW